MRSKSFLCVSLLCLALLSVKTLPGNACTNIIITKGASADGSCMVSYAADSHSLFGELYFHRAADWKPGTMMAITEWDSYRPLGSIPQVPHTYQTVGNMNEYQLIIGETTYGGREELMDPNGIMDYGSLIYTTLQRAKTAKEAINTIVELANKYGYPSEGETFSIADKDEAWIMDLIGKGPDNKGIVWVARRIPDGYICAHANQSRITTFPLDDPANCMYAPDVISFAREKGYFEGEDQDFSFRDAYNPLDFGTIRGCDARVWSAFNILCDGKFEYVDENGKVINAEAKDWLNYAMGYELDGEMPLFIKAVKKLTVKDVANTMRDHFEGTAMDMRKDIGAGGNALPYRWRPLEFDYAEDTYINERAIATQQTGFWFVAQARSYMPDEIGGILWFGCDDAATSYLTPIYASTQDVPECLRVGNGDLLHYSPTSTFWVCNRVANACYKMYDAMEPYVRTKIDAYENSQIFYGVPATDKMALKYYAKGQTKKLLDLITNYSVNTAQDQFNDWVKLEETLLVKFIDGNVKAQDTDGNFLHSKYGTGLPEGMTQPGYNDIWKEAVAKTHGETVRIPSDKQNAQTSYDPVLPIGELSDEDYYTGNFYIRNISKTAAGFVSDYVINRDARNLWHMHPNAAQTIIVIKGSGRFQIEGEEVRKLVEGDTIVVPANTWHWEGASPNSVCEILTITELTQNQPHVFWDFTRKL